MTTEHVILKGGPEETAARAYVERAMPLGERGEASGKRLENVEASAFLAGIKWERGRSGIPVPPIYPPSALYRPELTVDHDYPTTWHAKYGDVHGWGKTPAKAMADFDKAWVVSGM